VRIEDALDAPYLVIDTESNARDFRHDPLARTVGIAPAFRTADGIQYAYFPYQHSLGSNLDANHLKRVGKVIEDCQLLVCHNWKYDALALANVGIDIQHRPFADTMLWVHWLNENLLSKGLDFASQYYGGQPKKRSDLFNAFKKILGWEWIPAWLMGEYAENDALITAQLYEKLLPDFEAEGYLGDLWQLEQDFTRLIMKMESYGVLVDNELCKSELEVGKARMAEISEELGGMNPNSPKHLEVMLFDILKLKPFKPTNSGRPSFDRESMEHYEEELEALDNHTAKLVLEYRGWLKACSAYYGAYLKLQSQARVLHPSFKLHGTRTGRLSCERPNLQQIPRHSSKRWNGNAKRVIIARPGYTLWEVDYSNLEFRLGAIYANEPNMVEPLREGFKPFDTMAELLFGPDWTQDQRQLCKTFTYMTSYGAGIAKVGRVMKLKPDEAKKLRADFWNAYPGLRQATQRASMKAETRGYALLWSGRRRHFDGSQGVHKAFNAVIQGGAAELVKRIMLALNDVIDWDECKMLLQVHDSVVFEIRTGTEDYWKPLIQMTMENVSAIHSKFGTVPFPVEIKRWGST
jgi:DNA polymerase-1